mgnify:FL=1
MQRIQDAQAQAIQQSKFDATLAMVSQQTAAQVAAMTVEQTMEQLFAQRNQALGGGQDQRDILTQTNAALANEAADGPQQTGRALPRRPLQTNLG